MRLANILISSLFVVSASAGARSPATPAQVAEMVVAKKQAEVPSLRVADELNWFGFELLGPPPAGEGVASSNGTFNQYLKDKGIRNEVWVESANGKIVGLTFVKRLPALRDSDAFVASIRDHVSGRLGVPKSESVIYSGYSWPVKSEAKFLDQWRSFADCRATAARDRDADYQELLCAREPQRTRINEHLTDVHVERRALELIFLKLETAERRAASRQEGQRKRSDFSRQLNDADRDRPTSDR